MKTFNTYEAKTHLSRLIDLATKGEEVIIARAGKPVARLVGYEEATGRRVPDRFKGKIRMSEAFDAPLPDEIMRAFLGRGT